MASSSGSADGDFQSRVDKIFGSLAFSRATSSASAAASRQTQSGSSSVWSLPGREVEKREWNREPLASYDREDMPCASSFDELLKQQKISSTKPFEEEDDVNNEVFDDEWSIRASMGLDRTLDDEEEEDEYDKVALGKENDEHDDKGLPMKGVLSKSSGKRKRIRDPRANHVAAKIRLKEDESEANKLNSSADHPSKSKEPHSEESSKTVPPKPILKKKETSSSSEAKTSKRVRFDFEFEETSKKPEDTCSASASLKPVMQQGKTGACIPDYLVNPSKYTCYSFDPSSESDEKSQPQQEYMDIPKAVEGSEISEPESLEKVSFTPQKKSQDVKEDSSNSIETKPIVACQVTEDERPCETTEDENIEIGDSERSTSLHKNNGRQYRAKQSVDETDV